MALTLISRRTGKMFGNDASSAPARTRAHVRLVVIAGAIPAPVSIRIASGRECRRSLVEQHVVGAVRAYHEIAGAVVRLVFVDVVNLSARRQRSSERTLSDHDVFPYVALAVGPSVLRKHQSHIATRIENPPALPVRCIRAAAAFYRHARNITRSWFFVPLSAVRKLPVTRAETPLSSMPLVAP